MGRRRAGRVRISYMKAAEVYRARWEDPETGRDRSKRFKLKRDAEVFADEVDAAMLTGTYVDPTAGGITFREYAEEHWRPNQEHRESTAQLVERSLRRHVYPAIGDKKMGSIKPIDIARLKKEWQSAIAPSTARVTYRFVVAVFRSAVRDKVIATSPCADIKAPKVPPRRIKPLTTAQVQELAAAVPPRYRAMVILGATSGARRGELMGITIDRLDLNDRRSLTIDRQLVTRAAGRTEQAELKTVASYREVPLPDYAIAILREHIEQYTTGEAGALVFTNALGRPLKRSTVNAMWSEARKGTSVAAAKLHELRHYYASLLIRRGLSVRTVQERLGHASATETLETYSHLWPDNDEHTRSAVDAEFAAGA